MTRQRQRGFTLIELMVALLVSSLLVGMILAIFSRMSLAYRGQQQIAGVQQVLAAARATIEGDAKQAGFAVAQGFMVATPDPTKLQWPVQVIDSAAGPDRIAFFYADSSTQAVVTGVDGTWTSAPAVTVDSAVGFAAKDVVVLTIVDTTTAGETPGVDANRATFTSCVMQITQIAPGPTPPGDTIRFATAAPWGNTQSSQCAVPTAAKTMIYKFVARGYRIDPVDSVARRVLGPLQQSPTGGLFGTDADEWTDVAYGFTDIQVALRIFDDDKGLGAGDADGDGDFSREWFSGGFQTRATSLQDLNLNAKACALQATISLVARTDRDVEGVATDATPELRDAAKPEFNQVGNHESVALPSTTDDSLKGSRIYRYLTFRVDFRNLGVGL